MTKKLIMACMAVVAFAAFVLPASALATNDPTLTEAGGVHVKNGGVVGTNVGETTFTNTSGAGLVHCKSALMTGTLLANSGGTVEGTISTSDFWGGGSGTSTDNNLEECKGSFGDAYVTVEGNLCIRSTPTMATDEFQVGTDPASGKCSDPNGNVKFIIGSTTAGACTYETASTVKGDYTTNGSQAQLTVRNTAAGSGAKLTSGGFLCPSSGMLKMTFKLSTDDATHTPIFIS